MMRHLALKASAFALLGLAAAVPAAAESGPMPPGITSLDGPRWTTCFLLDRASGEKWVSGIFEAPAARPVDEAGWLRQLRARFSLSADTVGGCSVEESRDDAIWRHAVLTDEDPLHPAAIIEVADWVPESARRIAFAATAETTEPIAFAEALEPVAVAQEPQPATLVAQPAALPTTRFADESEFQRQYAEYERRLAEQKRQVEAFRQAQTDVA
ncbi:MAG TPA: hypothetical protein VFY95_09300, partial [Sphingomicrobium sp.]